MKLPDSPHAAVRPDWLARTREAIIEPTLPIVDPHHHLWERAATRYLCQDLSDDVNDGHNILSTVFIQSRSMLRATGDPAFASVGEVEFANGVAAMGASGIYGPTRLCAGIVGAADLLLGTRVTPVLEAMTAVAGGRLRGIRNAVVWHEDAAVQSSTAKTAPRMMSDKKFSEGVGVLAAFGLVLDVWAYHTQLDEVYTLAKEHPEVTVVIDHFGGPIGIGPHARDTAAREHMLSDWRRGMTALAGLPNTRVKLGGGGMPVLGFGFDRLDAAPASSVIADALYPYTAACIDLFGPDRCMFESNFPVDKGMFSYHVIWNAFKRLAAGASADEKQALFSGTAMATYGLASDMTPGLGT